MIAATSSFSPPDTPTLPVHPLLKLQEKTTTFTNHNKINILQQSSTRENREYRRFNSKKSVQKRSKSRQIVPKTSKIR